MGNAAGEQSASPQGPSFSGPVSAANTARRRSVDIAPGGSEAQVSPGFFRAAEAPKSGWILRILELSLMADELGVSESDSHL